MLNIARILYRVSCLFESGTLLLADEENTHSIILKHGHICNILDGKEPSVYDLGDRVIMLLRSQKTVSFLPSISLEKEVHDLFPVHPAPWIRAYIEIIGIESSFLRRAKPQLIQLAIPPHSSCLSREESKVIPFLLTPRSLQEIESYSLLSLKELYRFLSFLDQVGALSIEHKPPLALQAEYDILGLIPPVTKEQIKTAYRSLIRKHHPDAHPNANRQEQEAITDMLFKIQQAYQALSKGFQIQEEGHESLKER